MGGWQFRGYKLRCVRCGFCQDKKELRSGYGWAGKVCKDRVACDARVSELLKEESK